MQIIGVEISLNVYTIQMLLRIYIQVKQDVVCPFSCPFLCVERRQSGSDRFFTLRGGRGGGGDPDICQIVSIFFEIFSNPIKARERGKF